MISERNHIGSKIFRALAETSPVIEIGGTDVFQHLGIGDDVVLSIDDLENITYKVIDRTKTHIVLRLAGP